MKSPAIDHPAYDEEPDKFGNYGSYPVPRMDEPDSDEIEKMLFDGEILATDGCELHEPDATCRHGYPSWLVYLGMM